MDNRIHTISNDFFFQYTCVGSCCSIQFNFVIVFRFVMFSYFSSGL